MHFETIIFIGMPDPNKGIEFTYNQNELSIVPLNLIIDFAVHIKAITIKGNTIDVLAHTFYNHLN